MRKHPGILLLSIAGCLLATDRAALGQYPYPGQRYTPFGNSNISPYLNLRRGGNPAANYYLGVIPEMERRAVENRVDTNLNNLELERRLSTNPDARELIPTLPGTGHPAGFMTLSPYYNLGGPNGGAGTRFPQANTFLPYSSGRRR